MFLPSQQQHYMTKHDRFPESPRAYSALKGPFRPCEDDDCRQWLTFTACRVVQDGCNKNHNKICVGLCDDCVVNYSFHQLLWCKWSIFLVTSIVLVLVCHGCIKRIRPAIFSSNLMCRAKPTNRPIHLQVPCVYPTIHRIPLCRRPPVSSKNHQKHISEPRHCTDWHVPSPWRLRSR